MFSGSRDLWRVVYRDPEHVPERLTLYTANRLGDASREWARSVRSSHPDTPVAKIAEELRTQSAHVARIDGAISGTPFFIALVPGYLTYLQQEIARRCAPPRSTDATRGTCAPRPRCSRCAACTRTSRPRRPR